MLCGRCMSLKTVLMLGVQMLRRLADLHLAGYLHRDIKPGLCPPAAPPAVHLFFVVVVVLELQC